MANKIIGTGSAYPPYVLTNDELSTMVETNDEWIVERTGIRTRHIATTETTMDLAREASKKALEMAGTAPEEIDLIIVATLTSDVLTPSAAGYLQRDLGIQTCTAFDINANCSGFIFALCTADSLMKTCGYQKALVVGVEKLSKLVDWTERSTCVLFGDGAGAVVLSQSETGGILAGHMYSESDEKEVLKCYDAVQPSHFWKGQEKGYLYMDGRGVFRFATTRMAEEIKVILEKAGKTKEEITKVVPHQANVRIVSYAAKRAGIDASKFFVDVEKYGNTAAASVPLALDDYVRTQHPKEGDLIVMVGFGGGLTSGSIIVQW